MPALQVGRIINGTVYDSSSITIVINNLPFAGITEISYKDSLEPGVLQGTDPIIRGRTRGQYKAEASFTIGKKDFELVKIELAKIRSSGFGEIEFPITVTYRESADDVVITDVVEGCRIMSQENSHSSGNSDALVTKVDLSVIRIRWNGKYLVGAASAGGGLIAP